MQKTGQWKPKAKGGAIQVYFTEQEYHKLSNCVRAVLCLGWEAERYNKGAILLVLKLLWVMKELDCTTYARTNFRYLQWQNYK